MRDLRLAVEKIVRPIGAIAGLTPLVGLWFDLAAHREGCAHRDWKSLEIEE